MSARPSDPAFDAKAHKLIRALGASIAAERLGLSRNGLYSAVRRHAARITSAGQPTAEKRQEARP